MLDFNKIHARVKYAMNCDDNLAWEGINSAYLSLDTSLAEEQQAKWLKLTACGWILTWRMRPCLCKRANNTLHEIRAAISPNINESDIEANIFTSPNEPEDDKHFILSLVNAVPKEYRIPLTIVLSKLLEHAPTKPLSVETTRQILKAAKIPNASEYSRHIYTFLTTIKKILK